MDAFSPAEAGLFHVREAVTANIPSRILVKASAYGTITAEARSSADGTETGGILLGSTTPDAVIIQHAGEPGPAAIRQPRSFLRDLQYAQLLADEAFNLDGSIWIGEWHTHIDALPVPSERDLATYQKFLADPELAFDYFITIILDAPNSNWQTNPRMLAWIVTPLAAKLAPILPVTD